VKIHEYQAKQILARHGVATPRGEVATTPAQAGDISAPRHPVVVVKAQIHAGGRGKGGGVKVARSPRRPSARRRDLGMQLVTHQTGPRGRRWGACSSRRGSR